MTFLPPYAVLVSLAAAVLLPVVLLALSHPPLRIPPVGRRFKAAALITVAGWGVALVLAPDRPSVSDLAASLCLLIGALLAEFTLWTLVCWGFSIALLLELVRAEQPLDCDAWVSAYTGGGTIMQFTQDRLGVLLSHGMATNEDGILHPTRRGRLTARLDGWLRLWFGLRP